MKYKIIPILFLLTALAFPVLAVTEEEITSNLNCPHQDGCTMIAADCSCESALEIKEKVRGMLAQGLSEKQIYKRLEAEYGREVFATPPKEGFDWIVWLALPAGIITGGVIVYRISRRRMDEDEIFEYEYEKFLQEREIQ
jgi:cytochrome c-type biogenesis protein CcmH